MANNSAQEFVLVPREKWEMKLKQQGDKEGKKLDPSKAKCHEKRRSIHSEKLEPSSNEQETKSEESSKWIYY